MMSKKLREKVEEINPGEITAPRRSIPGTEEHKQEIAEMFKRIKDKNKIDPEQKNISKDSSE